MLRFIDTHTHFYDEAFAQDAEAAIGRAREAGVFKMIQPDVDSRERQALFDLTARYPGELYPMLGLYPGSVDAGWEKEVEALEGWLDRNPVAIGEIGLDYHWSTEYTKEQKRALKVQLEMADRLALPVNIHLRDATEDFLGVLHECRHLSLRGNMHAYSGSYETFLRLQDYGEWSLGIGGVVTYKNSKLAEVVRKVPLERILLETDSPYLPPVPHRGERNESAYIPLIAAKIAQVKDITIEEVALATTQNAEKLFRL
jgi:TatD DNase family protein